MKAVGVGIVGGVVNGTEIKGEPFHMLPEAELAIKKRTEGAKLIQDGLHRLLGVDSATPISHSSILREAYRGGGKAPKAGALIVNVAWENGPAKEEHTLWIDDGSRIGDEFLTSELGAEALFLKDHGVTLREQITPQTEMTRQIAITDTQLIVATAHSHTEPQTVV